MCRPVLQAAEKGTVEIVVSSIALVEVICKNKDASIDDQKVRDYFDNDYILLVSADKDVCDLARRLMLAGHAGLRPNRCNSCCDRLYLKRRRTPHFRWQVARPEFQDRQERRNSFTH